MATNALKGIMNFFKGRETKAEEAKEKKLSPAAYAKGEKKEGAKSTSAKKPMGTAAVKKPTVAKATTRAKKK